MFLAAAGVAPSALFPRGLENPLALGAPAPVGLLKAGALLSQPYSKSVRIESHLLPPTSGPLSPEDAVTCTETRSSPERPPGATPVISPSIVIFSSRDSYPVRGGPCTAARIRPPSRARS